MLKSCFDLHYLTIYRFQENFPSASSNEFGDMQLDSDREIGAGNELEIGSDCLTASEQSSDTDSDCNDHFADIDMDPDYISYSQFRL